MSELGRTDSNHNHSGVNLFAYEIEGHWHAGWFRIADGQLEVESGLERRAVRYDAANPDSLTDLLRQLLTEIVRDAPRSPDVAG